MHSPLSYLHPVDYYSGKPEALVTERKRKLKAAAARRKEVNRLIDSGQTKVGVYHFGRLNLSENDWSTALVCMHSREGE